MQRCCNNDVLSLVGSRKDVTKSPAGFSELGQLGSSGKKQVLCRVTCALEQSAFGGGALHLQGPCQKVPDGFSHSDSLSIFSKPVSLILF